MGRRGGGDAGCVIRPGTSGKDKGQDGLYWEKVGYG